MSNKELLKTQEPTFLQKARRKGYICPVCGNGEGRDGDGITKQPGTDSYKCFKCGFYGDVVDLFGKAKGIEDPQECFRAAYDYFGIKPGHEKAEKETIKPGYSDIEPQEDFTAFFDEAAKANDYRYLEERGISRETQQLFKVGFVQEWRSPKAIKTTKERGGNPANLPASPRCIIPRSRYSYLARDTRKNLDEDQKRFEKQNQGKVTFFNLEALKGAETVFIVEGEIDAMSVYEAAGRAVGLCSTANVAAFLKQLKTDPTTATLILMLDNDPAGRKAQAELAKGLSGLGVSFVEAEYSEHDPNDQLRKDRSSFETLISSLQAKAADAKQEDKGNQYNAGELLDYFRTIEKQPAGIEAKTGFDGLDDAEKNLYGGLHEGLYIIGAVSSLGKTTFCLQVADQIAERGQDVLFFSLEQSKYELISKSISRHTYKQNRKATGKKGQLLAKDTQQIMNNRRYKDYTQEDKAAIAKAIDAYAAGAQNLYIYEGRYKGAKLTVATIRQIIDGWTKEHEGRKPVIFIDYLQIIASENQRATDKQAVDDAVSGLKDISRDFAIPVFAISSFNRDSYTLPVSLTSFKESGSVEYSSDVLFGLQYSGMDYIPDEKEKDRSARLLKMRTDNGQRKRDKEPIQIDLKCLKNRNGTLFTIMFNFNPCFNCYEEVCFRPEDLKHRAGFKGTPTETR